jgi:multiple sugar transport system ATP-binding protein
VNNVPPKERDIAMVFQNYALYPHLDVFENMAFGLKLRKFPKAEVEARVREASRVLGLDEVLDRKPKQLSGGQRQRVALGRAIVRKPQVFLFDEPLSNLDAKLRVQTRAEISRLHRRLGATTVYVTHDQVEAMTMGDRIVVLKAGFIGSPAMNFLEGTLRAEDGHLVFDGGEGLRIAIPGERAGRAKPDQRVTLGVRPENLRPTQGEATDDSVIVLQLELLEPMGNEVFIYARHGAHQLVARVPPQGLPQPGEPIRLAVELDRVHLFDGETEERLA